jgi:hypothetical protein
MSKRSIGAVIIFTLITFGIYRLYWFVSTKNEMVAQGAQIPTAWLLIVPFANIYWFWKWSEGVDHVSRGKLSAGVTFLLVILLHVIDSAIIQSTFNKIADERVGLPRAFVA